MREIKFRAWGYSRMDDKEIMHEDYPITFRNTFINTILSDMQENVCTLMQYTGLKDKNGVDIYEGDIVIAIAEKKFADDTKISDVIFSDDLSWVVRNGIQQDFGLHLNWGGWESLEVIGNIYENPELIKE